MMLPKSGSLRPEAAADLAALDPRCSALIRWAGSMGTFDNQCMITGIELDDVACLLLIERPDGSHVPCALPIFGHRDPHGAIVEIEGHPAVDSLALGLAAAVDVGSLQLAVPSWLDPVDVSPDREPKRSKLARVHA
jgi:hypothetical protein